MNENDSGLNRYLQEIGRIPLLTPQQEVELAAKIKKGDAKARERMINANLRLVVTIAHDYANLGDKIAKVRRVSLQMSDELGREPTDDELGEEIGIASEKVGRLKSLGIRPASLDAPIGDDDSTQFSEVIGDEDAQTPFELLRDKDLLHEMDGVLDVLDKREKKIISQRFGLNGGKPKTLEDVGRDFGVTRERIRQLQNIALAKLRRALSKKEDRLAAAQPVEA